MFKEDVIADDKKDEHVFVYTDVPGDEEKETYLILIVHGIGSDIATQIKNASDLEASFKKIIHGNHYKTKYKFAMTIIDWRSICDSSKMRDRLARCRIKSQVNDERAAFDATVPDSLFYISSLMNTSILSRVAEQANHAFKQLALRDSLFFGKVSFAAHSLGSVIAYDILVKQNPNNFKHPDAELEASNKARKASYKDEEANEDFIKDLE